MRQLSIICMLVLFYQRNQFRPEIADGLSRSCLVPNQKRPIFRSLIFSFFFSADNVYVPEKWLQRQPSRQKMPKRCTTPVSLILEQYIRFWNLSRNTAGVRYSPRRLYHQYNCNYYCNLHLFLLFHFHSFSEFFKSKLWT